jgi:hypothetical protein
MKTRILFALLLIPALTFAQIKGKKSKKPYKTPQGTEFKVGDKITLGKPSNGDKFAFVYVKKSALSIANIKNAVNTVNNVKNLNVNNVNSVTNAIKSANNLANNELIDEAVNKLIGQAVSASYVEKNALDTSMIGKTFKIKQFKVYTDKESGDQIVHAIAKGNGKSVAILLEFAEKTGEI